MKRPGPKVRREPPAPIRRFERERASQALGEPGAGQHLPVQDDVSDIVSPPASSARPGDRAARSVVLVVATALVQGKVFEEALTLSFGFVARSSAEPGCLGHAVYQDFDNRRRLVFLSQWSDSTVLRSHFELPTSIAFASELERFTIEKPRIEIYDATQRDV